MRDNRGSQTIHGDDAEKEAVALARNNEPVALPDHGMESGEPKHPEEPPGTRNSRRLNPLAEVHCRRGGMPAVYSVAFRDMLQIREPFCNLSMLGIDIMYTDGRIDR